jgi:hypothetical protein
MLYIDLFIWLCSIVIFAWAISRLPQNPDHECTELGKLVCMLISMMSAISALILSSRLVLRILAS